MTFRRDTEVESPGHDGKFPLSTNAKRVEASDERRRCPTSKLVDIRDKLPELLGAAGCHPKRYRSEVVGGKEPVDGAEADGVVEPEASASMTPGPTNPSEIAPGFSRKGDRPPRILCASSSRSSSDSREPRGDPVPAFSWTRWIVESGVSEWSESRGSCGAQSRHQPRGSQPREAAIDDECSHANTRRRSRSFINLPIGSLGRGPPGVFDHCSTSQPRLRAIAARRVSGFTATG